MQYPKCFAAASVCRQFTRRTLLFTLLFGFILSARAQTSPPPSDYTNALWNQAYQGHWYTTGNGHHFCVIHDMEGYYEATISYFQQAQQGSDFASIHYCVNSLQNGSDSKGHAENNPGDAPAGEITQMVREAYYAWHVSCWNRYMFGTEHEGFVNSPAWYSEAMYQASAKLQQHLCNNPKTTDAPIPMDRNHIIGHDEHLNPAWTDWMATNWPAIDTTCNDHTDPGQYWNWPHFMELVCMPNIVSQPTNQSIIQGQRATFSVSATNIGTNNPTTFQWLFNGNPILGATNSSLTVLNAQVTDVGLYSVVLSNAYSSVISSNAALNFAPTVQPRPTSAIVTWITATPSDSEVDFGLTPQYEAGSVYDDNLVTNHSVLLTGLLPNHTYYFQVISYDADNNQSTASGSFFTDPTIILQSSQASYSGVWINDNSAPNRYSPVYKYASVAPAAPQSQATFRPNIITPGQYDVYYWYTEGGNRSHLAPVMATFQGGYVSTVVDESANGGNWHLITADQTFASGTNAFVQLSNYTGESNKIIIADAVKWVYRPGQDIPANGVVPSWWANYYFGSNTVNSASIAANGYSILNDYILGIAPNDPFSTLDFDLAPSSTGFQATFSPWMGGRIYQLQCTTNLAHPVWQTVTNLQLTNDGFGNGFFTSTNVPSVPTFYRLSVQLVP